MPRVKQSGGPTGWPCFDKKLNFTRIGYRDDNNGSPRG